MDRNFARPKLFVSSCLSFEACRWNGVMIDEPLIEALKPCADIVRACPEMAVGLGAPRHPVRLVGNDNSLKLLQPATGLDLSLEMKAFSKAFVAGLGALDGAILKFKSPSCGPSNVKVYRAIDKPEASGKGSGLFAAELLSRFPELPAEDEGRLKNFVVRESFLTRVFLGAKLRETAAEGRASGLVEFHSRCKYLLMACSQSGLRKLGRIVASGGKGSSAGELFAEYSSEFAKALAKPFKPGSALNALQHMAGYFSAKLSQAERAFFQDLLEEYLRGSLPLSAPVGVLKSWAIRFDEKYILEQYLLRPYPEALVSITDSGKGRDY